MIRIAPTVSIVKHQWETEAKRLCTRPNKSFIDAFLDTDFESLIWAADGHCSAIYWAWLQWQLDADFNKISDGLTADAMRAAEALASGKLPRRIDERGFHDWMMMNAAILSGNALTMRAAAEQVRLARSDTERYQYNEAAAGILACRILGEEKRERAQYEMLQRYRPMRINPWPSKALTLAFVERDNKRLARTVAQDAEKHWSDRYLNLDNRRRTQPVIVKQDADSIVVNLRNKDSYFWWPYVEAAFAKLAVLDGVEINYDSFWMPLAFVKAVKNTSAGI